MITEDYVSLEIAKLLKGKGFDEYCFATYSTEIGDFITVGPIKNSEIDADKDDTYICTAPTHQMVMKWLREIKNIEIDVSLSALNADGTKEYMYDVFFTDERYIENAKIKAGFKTYEEAVEAAIKYCLTDLI